jgi:nitronate monooxygenase
MSNGGDILAAQAMGADLAYMGTRFIATEEAHAAPDYKKMIVDSKAADIVYSSLFSGIHGNYLKGSVANAGYDPDDLPTGDSSSMDFSKQEQNAAKAWRDIWSAGQGAGGVDEILPAAELVVRIEKEYDAARVQCGTG